MNVFYTLLVGIASSLSAMLIAFALIRWRWPALLKRISGSKVFGHGIDFGYYNQKQAENDMKKSFNNSKKIDVLCMRAYSITQPDRPFRYLLDDRSKIIRILISDPGDQLNDNPEIAKRAREYPKTSSPQAYRRSVFTSIESVLQVMKNNSNVSCNLHKLPSCYRLYISDERAFISFFTPDLSGTQLPILSAKKNSPLYNGMQRYFDQVWEKSKDVNELKYTPS